MSLEIPLPGYGPNDYPCNVKAAAARQFANMLSDHGFSIVAASATTDSVPVSVMVEHIDGAHRTGFEDEPTSVVGPYIFNDKLLAGNAIAVWERPRSQPGPD